MKAFILCALFLFFVAANAARAAHAVARSEGKVVTWQGQEYVVGPPNSLCENGMIKNLSECKQVAKQLNNDFGDEEEVADYPGGCYVWSDTVYFNNNFAGASEEVSLPICGQVSTTEATPVETASTAGRNARCWEGDSKYYSGKISRSVSGHECLYWADKKDKNVTVQGQKFKIRDGFFPNGESLKDAANYCRSPYNNEGGPWCYVDAEAHSVTNPDVSGYFWQYCDVPWCNGDNTLENILRRLDALEKLNIQKRLNEVDYDVVNDYDDAVDDDWDDEDEEKTLLQIIDFEDF